MSWAQPLSSRSADPTIVALSDGIGHPSPDVLFVPGGAEAGEDGRGASAADWREAGWPLQPDGTLVMPVGAFLISSGDRLVLVDCGYGDRRPAAVQGPSLGENLARLSVSPQEVTDVVLTHLHIDHFGGATRRGQAGYPRAVYRCHRADWRWLMDGDPGGGSTADYQREVAAEVLGPIVERFEVWDSVETIAAGVEVIPVGGHTPGSSIIGVGAGRTRRLLLGDLVHHPVQLVNQDWRRGPDEDPETARTIAADVVAQVVAARTPVVGSHFPDLRHGRVETNAAGDLRWRPDTRPR